MDEDDDGFGCFDDDRDDDDDEDEDGSDADFDSDFDEDFADPGGESALRAAGPGNPRNLPCPTCGAPDKLTPKDRKLGYQCDRCATRAENGYDF